MKISDDSFFKLKNSAVLAYAQTFSLNVTVQIKHKAVHTGTHHIREEITRLCSILFWLETLQ